jgi:dTDP-4-dehydrorhamnose 3,5-epimerase
MIEYTDLEEVLLVTPPMIHEDFRGTNVEIFNKALYENGVLDKVEWKIDSVSTSRHHVLRGVHGDENTYKLISCLYGTIYLLVVDNRPWSPQYKEWTSFTLSDKNRKQVLVPPGFGNGHLVMSKTAVFHYKWSKYYNREAQFTIKWNDPEYEFWWPVRHPILSARDA